MRKKTADMPRYQRERKERLIAAGLCINCALAPIVERNRCGPCADRQREAERVCNRKKRGHKPWRPGGPGHPPKKT